MKKNIIKSFVVIITFLVSFYGRGILDSYFNITNSIQSDFLRVTYAYAWWIIPVIIVLWIFYGLKNIIKELKLNQSCGKGILWALIIASPMVISSSVLGKFNSDITFLAFIKSTIFAGFFEETFFRAFFFLQLFYRFKWGFIPAVLLNAIAFASGHLYQGSTMNETLGVFIVTLMGAAWFSWLFIEWEKNIWLPIGLHVFMNMSWILFHISETALGGMSANIFRAITIAASIIITIRFSRKSGGLKVNRNNLLINRS